jgi:uncharacterized protein YuzE
MKIKYFPDTDTALIEFADRMVAETRELSEDIYVDMDQDGRLVSMTIEHAQTSARIKELSFQEVAETTAA